MFGKKLKVSKYSAKVVYREMNHSTLRSGMLHTAAEGVFQYASPGKEASRRLVTGLTTLGSGTSSKTHFAPERRVTSRKLEDEVELVRPGRARGA